MPPGTAGELPSLTPKDLSALLDDYSRFSADNTNLPWLQTEQQYFSSGQGTKAGTLILRHDFERECIVQLTITVENAPAGAAKGPFIMECDDVPQRKSLESLVTDVLQVHGPPVLLSLRTCCSLSLSLFTRPVISLHTPELARPRHLAPSPV